MNTQMFKKYIQLKPMNHALLDKTVDAGNLWELVSSDCLQLCYRVPDEIPAESRLVSLEVDVINHKFHEQFEHLDEDVFQLLIAIPEKNRLTVFQSREWINEGLAIKVGTKVCVLSAISDQASFGIVRYVGEVSRFRGRHFGVELNSSFKGEGTSDGKFQKKRYFTCEEDSAVFRAINKLRIFQETNSEELQQVSTSTNLMRNNTGIKGQDNINCNKADVTDSLSCEAIAMEQQQCATTVGARVVWYSDLGPEYGTVRWIGTLPEAKEISVGVEFDRAVGKGTGRHRSVTLFEAKRGHASFLPPMGLISAADFEGTNFALENKLTKDSASCNFVHEDVLKNAERTPAMSQMRSRSIVQPLRSDIAKLETVCGQRKGVQSISGCSGCAEAVIFTMFYLFNDFDSYIRAINDATAAEVARLYFIEEIIYPLRTVMFVNLDRIKGFKDLVRFLFSLPSALPEIPSDFVNYILSHLFQSDSLITFASGESCCVYTIPRVDTHSKLVGTPSIQHLLEFSAMQSNNSLKFDPDSLRPMILDLSVDQFVIYPNLHIDISNLIEGFSRECKICGVVCVLQCLDCFGGDQGKHLNDVIFCRSCYEKYHCDINSRGHSNSKELGQPNYSCKSKVLMELFAIVSLVDHRYVSFVKYQSTWLMHANSFQNIPSNAREPTIVPEVKCCPEVDSFFASTEFHNIDVALLQPVVRKMLTGLRLCFYRKLK